MDVPSDTRERIKVSAQRLFAERGIEAVSVRQIAAAAEARNVGSLSYYFGSKEGLIAELVADYFAAVSQRWADELRGLDRRSEPASVTEVVEIIVRARARAGQGGGTALRFMASMLFTRRHMLNGIMSDTDHKLFGGLIEHVRRARPDIPLAIMQQRLVFLAWYLVAVLSALEAHDVSGAQSAVWSGTDPIENIILTGAAIVEAPLER